MLKSDFTDNPPATQETQSTIEFILPDGVHSYNHPIDKYVVVVDGEMVTWAHTRKLAWDSYHDFVDYNYEYRRSILVNECGATVSIMVDWRTCPDCLGTVDNGQQCPRCSQPVDTSDFIIIHRPGGTYYQSRDDRERWEAK